MALASECASAGKAVFTVITSDLEEDRICTLSRECKTGDGHRETPNVKLVAS
jgi:hypothetical protein